MGQEFDKEQLGDASVLRGRSEVAHGGRMGQSAGLRWLCSHFRGDGWKAGFSQLRLSTGFTCHNGHRAGFFNGS